MADMKTVLIKFKSPTGLRNRPVTFNRGRLGLQSATKVAFQDIVSKDADPYFQLYDQSWGGGVFVDLLEHKIPPCTLYYKNDMGDNMG